ncbi:hypothetical protein M405DRAFT_828681 [Rhizopogon salebrosus TDB-379]|nr:hypothetical protein M405DRAFT_828681 [Rhizopogon salebrosus TDB-379]
MVDTDNAKSKRKFKKLYKNMGDKLDKEKGHAIESLEASSFNRNTSTDLSRQRAVEHECSREASQNACPGMIKRMQFAFSTDTPPGSFPATSGLPPPPTPSRYLPPLAPNIIHYLPH